MKNNSKLISYLLISYFIVSFYWVLAYWLNPYHSSVHDYISDLFVSKAPYNWLFRLLEVLSGLFLYLIVHFSDQLFNIKKSADKLVKKAVQIVGVMTVFDGIVINDCIKSQITCGGSAFQNILNILHGLESVVVALIMIWLSYYIYKNSLSYNKIFAFIFIILAGSGLYHLYDYGHGPINGIVQRIFGAVFGVLIILIFYDFKKISQRNF